MSLISTFPKGAEWRKWDLHVHTPYSLVQHYNGENSDARWEQFLSDLESLPPEFDVIGINDYLFIDGYKKVLDYRSKGRLQNINTILPVVEFRIRKFAGHKDFKRINFHVIFSDALNPNIIQNQFLNGLVGKYKLSPGLSGVSWSGIITPESLSDLGKAIKDTIPAEQLYKFGGDLEEGFNNLNLDESEIISLLKTNSYLNENYLTAIGKTEWASLPWSDQSIAEKKDIINKVDFVFISSESAEACCNAKNKLKEQLVNHILLDCSDAHYNASESSQKDRIGKCFTWIKGDPTFNGLRQIKYEPETRIVIQDDFPEEKTAYDIIDKVKFVTGNNTSYFDGNVIELNPNLNVIIGGKSSGKSLLLYHIAKAIDPVQVTEKLSVVNEEEYDLVNKIQGFDFKVKWKDGVIDKLSDGPDNKNRQITYVPQMYINHLAEQKGEKKLAELIETILHQNDKFREFSEGQNKKIQELNLKIGNDINEVYVIRENYQNAHKEYREIGDKKAIEANIERIKKEIASLNEKAGFTQEEIVQYKKFQQRKERVAASKGRIERYKSRVGEYIQEINDLKDNVSNRFEDVATSWFEISDPAALYFIEKNIAEDIRGSNTLFDRLIQKYNNLAVSLEQAINTKTQNIARVDAALLPYTAKISNQQLLKRLAKEVAEDEAKIKKIAEKEKQLAQIKDAGSNLRSEISASVNSLFEHYKQILEEIQNPELSQIGTDLHLDTILEIDIAAFQNGFCGLLDGRSNFNTVFGECFDASNNYVYSSDTHLNNLKTIFDKVWSSDQHQIKFRSGYNSQDAIVQLLKDHYKFKYNIKYNGDNILQMSPGKRGLVLLQIILHLSNAKHPILIDQPEDNLDNRTIFNNLNNFIKEKKNQRQIILVTHNANLVVSTDAEEVIVANQNGQDAGKVNEKYQFEYVTGSLENTFEDPSGKGILQQMGIREHVCDILEGGKEAFMYRERKYGFIS